MPFTQASYFEAAIVLKTRPVPRVLSWHMALIPNAMRRPPAPMKRLSVLFNWEAELGIYGHAWITNDDFGAPAGYLSDF